ncbi:MAG: hypothetical protein A2583_01245 [Bdellovibrionales bacterium RIFOXYD1_FULL_53_11]|nr:MAG: hypothetical protein A2583_01245 [Bdellovibrionales bacterium RIFOXYD1_FULL_53_11]
MKQIRPPINEIDYVYLTGALSHLKYPRDKIKLMLRKGELTRVKKGLYVFHGGSGGNTYSMATLANLVYGPSYISRESALSHYGLIPERVETVTSMTLKRSRYFKTPVGDFEYKHLTAVKFATGITLHKEDRLHNILIATREKALIDRLAGVPGIESIRDLEEWLFDDMRIDEQELRKFKKGLTREITKVYKDPNADLFVRYIGARK